MENKVNINFKIRLHHYCMQLLEDKINEIKQAINSQKEGLNASSSAGDKHNTEQAMQHLEEEKKHQLLYIAIQNKKVFSQIKPMLVCQKIQLGALAETNHGLFYFSVPLGKISFENQDLMLLSMASPISKILSRLKVNESHCYNQQLWVLNDIK